MREIDKAPESMLKFSGTPAEIGGEIFLRMCIPAVNMVTKNLDPLAAKQLYCGFLAGLLGAMTKDFGQKQATKIAQTILDTYAICDMGGERRQQ